MALMHCPQRSSSHMYLFWIRQEVDVMVQPPQQQTRFACSATAAKMQLATICILLDELSMRLLAVVFAATAVRASALIASTNILLAAASVLCYNLEFVASEKSATAPTACTHIQKVATLMLTPCWI